MERIRFQLEDLVTKAAEQCRSEQAFNYSDLPEFAIETPRDEGHGDFACNVAMLLARQARMAPRKIAEEIAARIDVSSVTAVENVEVAGAGFINFFMDDVWLAQVPSLVTQMDAMYGCNPSKRKRIQVEFVSANPTGNLHIGNARGGALGDSLANILIMDGYEVSREFYINDAGNQIDIFAASLEARYLQLLGHSISFPENGYAGKDVADTVQRFIGLHRDNLVELDSEERRRRLVDYALEEKSDYMLKTLADFGVFYDVWFSERSLHESGQVAALLNALRAKGYLYEEDGALWFRAGNESDVEKDEVVVRANGVPTYFAADIAYHVDKFERGFDRVINIWGADHHGHVARMKSALKAMGYDPDNLDIILMQLVRLFRGTQLIKMSKRTGTTVALDELIEEVGRDAARFSFVMRSSDSGLDFDLQLARQKSLENPVYYVQYAHARIMSIHRQAAAAGVKLIKPEQLDYSVLGSAEKELLRKIADFPEEIAIAARTLAPHRIARYAMDLATIFHSFYNHHRVLNDDESLQNARLLLVELVRITIKNALTALGVEAPDHM